MQHKSSDLMNDIIEFIDNDYSLKGRVPTMQEIANHFNISKGCVSKYIKVMADNDLIENKGGSRGIVTKTMQMTRQDTMQVAVVGSIACGKPLLAEENIENYLPIPKAFLGKGKYFILKASGNSMINAGICDGDYVIVKQQEYAEEGQIVVALIDDEATLKRFYRDDKLKKIRLHPENNRMKDMYFDSIVIQGVAVKVIKDLT